MANEQVFRWLFVFIFLATLFTSAFFRRRARQSGETIPRAREGGRVLFLRLLFAAPLFGSILAYMLNPDWMAWSALPLPAWLRWLGAAVGLGLLPMLYWVFTSLGSNISETTLTKTAHVLVTHGPYRWVRHPLYATATAVFLALSVLAANWFLMAVALLAIGLIALFVIPREETELIKKFGAEYRAYTRRAGALFPRLRLFD